MFTAVYNRACPVCRIEIDHYERTCHAAGVPALFVDIHQEPDALAEHGLTTDDAKRRLCCIEEDGTLHGGIDAVAVIWRAMPSHRWLARIVQFPGVNWVAHWGYDRVLAPTLYAWSERRLRRQAVKR
jgi:predicted DCC family thiol-disulfide oxidoreductase YuxK